MLPPLPLATAALIALGAGGDPESRGGWTPDRLDREVSSLAREVGEEPCTGFDRACAKVKVAVTDDGIVATHHGTSFHLRLDEDDLPSGRFEGDENTQHRWAVMSCAFRAPAVLAMIEPAVRRLARDSVREEVAELQFLELLGLRAMTNSDRPRHAAVAAACACHGKLLREKVPHRLVYFDAHEDGRAVDGFAAVFAATGSTPAESMLEGVYPLAPR